MLNKLFDSYPDVEFLIADGFDDAIIGVDEETMRLIYSVSKCLKILQKQMSQEEAVEYFYFNVSGSHIGAKTPIWCNDLF